MTSTRQQGQPRKQPRQHRSRQTRQRILDAAARVFADHGYAAGTTNRIAERAGLSIGSLYQYFPNKDVILVELMTAHLHAGIATTREKVRGRSARPPRGHPAAVRPRDHRQPPRGTRTSPGVVRGSPPTPRVSSEMLHESEAGIVATTQAVLSAHPQVGVTDTHTAARLVVAAIESLVHRLIASPTPIAVTPFEKRTGGHACQISARDDCLARGFGGLVRRDREHSPSPACPRPRSGSCRARNASVGAAIGSMPMTSSWAGAKSCAAG